MAKYRLPIPYLEPKYRLSLPYHVTQYRLLQEPGKSIVIRQRLIVTKCQVCAGIVLFDDLKCTIFPKAASNHSLVIAVPRSQVVRKLAKKPKGSLEGVTKNLRRKLSFNSAILSWNKNR